MGLLVVGKANLVLDGRGVIRTVSQNFPKPSIIRLQEVVKRPRLTVKLNKKEIFRRDKYRCQYCGASGPTLTVDHVVPQRLGGESTWDNLVTACAKCNHKKGGQTLEQSGLTLETVPHRPSNSAKYLFSNYLKHYEEWEPFVRGW